MFQWHKTTKSMAKDDAIRNSANLVVLNMDTRVL
jgi:hypothetical protein